jgi:hypothetical protein
MLGRPETPGLGEDDETRFSAATGESKTGRELPLLPFVTLVALSEPVWRKLSPFGWFWRLGCVGSLFPPNLFSIPRAAAEKVFRICFISSVFQMVGAQNFDDKATKADLGMQVCEGCEGSTVGMEVHLYLDLSLGLALGLGAQQFQQQPKYQMPIGLSTQQSGSATRPNNQCNLPKIMMRMIMASR